MTTTLGQAISCQISLPTGNIGTKITPSRAGER
jgi:hypothetical protein